MNILDPPAAHPAPPNRLVCFKSQSLSRVYARATVFFAHWSGRHGRVTGLVGAAERRLTLSHKYGSLRG